MVGMAGIYHKGVGMDNHHKGIGQAGNKSMLSFRGDIGIPGYTGYIPTSCSVQLPTKGSTIHTGKIPSSDHSAQVTAGSGKEAASEYTSSMKAELGQFVSPTTRPGGIWQKHSRGEHEANKSFVGNTTYTTEVVNSQDTANAAQTLGESIRPTLAGHVMAQKTAKAGRTLPSNELGYKTNYTSMVVEEPLTGGTVAAGRPRSEPKTGSSELRTKVIQRTLDATFHGSTMYREHFGTLGSDPLSKSARHESLISKTASTKELQEGTSKNTQHIPGYSGFVPSAQHNGGAVGHADCVDPRESAKDGMLLCSLDQFSRHSVPNYSGFRTQAPYNLGEAMGPNVETTSGTYNAEATKHSDAIVDKANHLSSAYGTQSFFTSGTASISQNGKALGERYYHSVRPREGLPRIHYPSKVTVAGAPFKN